VLAILVIALGIGGLIGLVVYGVFDDLRTETAALREDGPEAAERLAERDDRIGRVARDLRLPERAEDAFAAVENRFGVDSRTLASAAGALPAYFVSFILTMFLMLHGPGIVKGGLDQLGYTRRRRWGQVLLAGVGRGRRYLWVAMAQGAVVGFATYAVAWSWSLPAPTVLSLVAGALATVPYIGILMGSIATVLLTAGFKSVGWALVVFAVAALLQVGEALFLRRVLDRRTLHVGPAVPVIVGTIGLDLYAIGGAVLAMAAAVLVMGVLDAAADDESALPTPSDDWVDVV
jgi:predicted PurR-regulated permease PerM